MMEKTTSQINVIYSPVSIDVVCVCACASGAELALDEDGAAGFCVGCCSVLGVSDEG